MSLRSQRTAVTLAVTCLVLSSLAWAGEVKPPVNAGEAWRVYDASGKEVSRLVLGGIDVKTGQLSYTTVDLATGTAAPAAHALPWEVRDVIKRMNEAKGSEEFRVGEIFLSATDETRAAVLQNAQKIVEQLKNGQVDAVTTDEAILIGYAAQAPDATIEEGSTRVYGWTRTGPIRALP